MSQFDADKQFEQLQSITPDDFTLPSDMPNPVQMPDDFGPTSFGKLPDFFETQKEARDLGAQEQNDQSLLEAIRELPERIAEALRNG